MRPPTAVHATVRSARCRTGAVGPVSSGHRARHAHARHGRRAAGHLGRLRCLSVHPRLNRLVRRHFPDAAQSLEPARCRPRRSRSWRPAWCWSSSCATSTCRSARCCGLIGMIMGVAQVEFLSASSARRRPSVDLDHRACRRHGARRCDRRVPGLHHRLCWRCPPSSSRSAACWSGAARRGWSSAARRSRRWTRPSS